MAPSEAPTNAQVIEEPIERVLRGRLVRVAWIGGDPAVDLPRVSLIGAEREEVISHPYTNLPFDDSGFESMLRYLGDYGEDQRWESVWDLPHELPPGRYRFAVTGMIGTLAERYELLSAPFELSGEEGLSVHEITRARGVAQVRFTYPDAPTNDDGESPLSRLKTTGSLLHVRRRGIDLSTPTSGALKPFRYILGGPVVDSVQVSAWRGARPNPSEPRAPDLTLSLIPTLATCTRNLVTARDEGGAEELTTLSDVPCSEITLELEELDPAEELWIELRDAHGNVVLTRSPNR